MSTKFPPLAFSNWEQPENMIDFYAIRGWLCRNNPNPKEYGPITLDLQHHPESHIIAVRKYTLLYICAQWRRCFKKGIGIVSPWWFNKDCYRSVAQSVAQSLELKTLG